MNNLLTPLTLTGLLLSLSCAPANAQDLNGTWNSTAGSGGVQMVVQASPDRITIRQIENGRDDNAGIVSSWVQYPKKFEISYGGRRFSLRYKCEFLDDNNIRCESDGSYVMWSRVGANGAAVSSGFSTSGIAFETPKQLTRQAAQPPDAAAWDRRLGSNTNLDFTFRELVGAGGKGLKALALADARNADKRRPAPATNFKASPETVAGVPSVLVRGGGHSDDDRTVVGHESRVTQHGNVITRNVTSGTTERSRVVWSYYIPEKNTGKVAVLSFVYSNVDGSPSASKLAQIESLIISKVIASVVLKP